MFEKKPKKQNRFIIKENQIIGSGAVQLIVDTVTGVNYLNTVGVSMSGLTPLLDENGKVVVTPVPREEEAE